MALELISPPRSGPSAVVDLGQPPSGAARLVTTLVVGVPFVALVYCVVRLWDHGVGLRDVALAVGCYLLAGHGISIGFHRLLAHRSFIAARPLKLVLVAFGSMAFEGGPIGWVVNHRRHHTRSDTPDDPHSPWHHGGGVSGQLKGLWHAHVGWLFVVRGGGPASRDAADLLADRDIVVMNSLFPVWCVVSLALPFGAGWLLGGSFGAAVSALVWAGLVRICVLHHATWSINSLCHMFGRRPFSTTDRSGNVAALAVLSMGESWHNGHHAFPRSARHGLLKRQWDSSGRLIRVFERLNWVTDVHWPSPEALRNRATDVGRRRRSQPDHRPVETEWPPRVRSDPHARRPRQG